MKIRLLSKPTFMKLQTIYIHKPSDVLFTLKASLLRSPTPAHRLKHFWVLSLTGSNLVTHVDLVAIGSRTYSIVDLSEVFRTQILNAAKKVIVVCDCYGKSKVSPTHMELAKASEFTAYGDAIGIPVIDYVIRSQGDYYSQSQQTTLQGYKTQQ